MQHSKQWPSSTNRRFFGQRYLMPKAVRVALEQVFGPSVAAVNVVEYSRYARAHFGVTATTRPNYILLTIGGEAFASSPELLLHEYFHVLRQWNTGRLTRWRYLIESARHGYWNNCFEREARDFSTANLERYRDFLKGEFA